jgi:hypothetical protein
MVCCFASISMPMCGCGIDCASRMLYADIGLQGPGSACKQVGGESVDAAKSNALCSTMVAGRLIFFRMVHMEV